MSIDYGLIYRVFHDPDDPQHVASMIRYHRGMLSRLLPPPTDAPVLDVGCGFGFVMNMLQESGFSNVMGIDIDAGQVETCKRRGLSVDLTSNSAAYLNERPQQFALVTMTDVLEHVPVADQIALVKAVYNALKPGGRLVVQVPNATTWLAARNRYMDFTHKSSFTEHSLTFVFRAAGFPEVIIPGDGKLGRPPVKLWTRAARRGLRRWILRWLWRSIVAAEFDGWDVTKIPLGLNMVGAAIKH